MFKKICSSISEEDLYNGHSAIDAMDTLKLYNRLYNKLNSGEIEESIDIINKLGKNIKYFMEYVKLKK